MPILVETVRVANFRSLKNIEVVLTPLVVLVGANNAGKTSFLKALNLALGIERRNVSNEDFNIAKDDNGEQKQIKIDIRIVPVDAENKRVEDFDDLWRDVEFGDLISIDNQDRQYVAFRTEISFNPLKNDFEIKKFKINNWPDDPTSWETIIYKDSLKPSFPCIPLFFIDAQRDILEDLRSRTSYLGKLVSKVKISPEKLKELEDKIKTLNDDIVENSDILSHLKEKLKELSNTIQSGNTGIDITPVNKKIRDLNKGLNINFQDGKNESFPLEYHGMGTRSWASLLAFKAYISWLSESFENEGVSPYHPILALEEPEAHLHPNAQRHLYSQLLNISGQKIISSHSPYISGQCKLEEIKLFYKVDDVPQISFFDSTDLDKEDIRKLQREVFHSRGELIFSKAIVFFEGETEEQALPIFAKSYWGSHPFETGINFVGVGGHGNYLPFLRFCKSFHIPWFLLSDGEDEAIKSVRTAGKKIGLDENNLPSNISIIPNKNNFEEYLIAEGYQEEIKTAILACLESTFHSPEHKQAKTEEIAGWQDAEIKAYMESNKTALCCDLAEKIVGIADKKRRFPKSIESLFEEMSKQLNITIAPENK